MERIDKNVKDLISKLAKERNALQEELKKRMRR